MYKRHSAWSADTREQFRTVKNVPPDTVANRFFFVVKLLADFHFASIYDCLSRVLPQVRGKVLDVGCGQSPYKHLLAPGQAQYFGVDVIAADKFDYAVRDNPGIIQFDGKSIPFSDGYFDFFLCTEVLEHTEEPQKLINEIHRVLKPGATGIFTVPWAGKLHYIPYDYHRFTPVTLIKYFGGFGSCEVVARGTDITVIASKILIVYLRAFAPSKNIFLWPLKGILALALLPVIALVALIGQLSLLLRIGSADDPLGYTVTVRK